VVIIVAIATAARNIVQNAVVVPVNAFQIMDCRSLLPRIIGVFLRGFRGQTPLIESQSLCPPPIRNKSIKEGDETTKGSKEELECFK
jgi:hypothetical protein